MHRVDSPVVPDIPRLQARRRIILFAGLGIAAYLIAMVWTMPAGVFLKNRQWRSGIAGTIWNGEVGIAGGTVVEWRWAPLRSITSLGFAVDWTATGADTAMGGRALIKPGRVVVENVSGSMDAGMLAALAPSLPFTCALTMQVEAPLFASGGGAAIDGTATTDPGTCTTKAGNVATAVGPLLIASEKIGTESRIRVAPATMRRQTLIDARLSEGGALSVTLTGDGARALPFIGLPAGAAIELEL
ncbi:type II secretion system protein N [Sphingomonas japonica]|uniref:General secretion pathway protein N n=1 Tax=Sphingomonas japonica TaxID=511662 RepID=A0ABX0U224_9SPHN|nr:type II secretion system protein N [Sphingomonas japonica]NIJ24555.1 hypothetical protein [Sphingomonas japonica]